MAISGWKPVRQLPTAHLYVDNASISPPPKSIRIASDRYNDLVVEQTRDANVLGRFPIR